MEKVKTGDKMVTVTEKAAEEIGKVLKTEDKEGHGIKIFIAGMGCSGPSYNMALAEEPEEGEKTIEANGVKLFVDEQVEAALEGQQIDYIESEYGSGFTIYNPDQPAACGSGCSSC